MGPTVLPVLWLVGGGVDSDAAQLLTNTVIKATIATSQNFMLLVAPLQGIKLRGSPTIPS
jgi:hypothetical protein